MFRSTDINKQLSFKKIKAEHVLFILSMIVGGVALYFSYKLNLITAYGDSKGHLNIARRVFDSPTHGVAQLGAYWLPLLHILMLLGVWNNFLWHSGLAGSIPNIVAYGFSVVYMYKLVNLFTNNKTSAFLAALVLLLNPNFLYMATTPMTEVLFVLTVLGVTYHFYKWTKTNSMPHLMIASVWAMLSSATRYEGWAVVAIATFLLFIQWIKSRLSKKWEGTIVIFSIVAWLGIVLWILWGAILVHDPLDFMRNDLSARSQTKTQFAFIQPTGEHYWPGAVAANVLAFQHVVGIVATIMVFVASAFYLVKFRSQLLNIKFNFALLFFAPLLFDILSVYLGNVPIEVPELSLVPPPGNFFNVRYALFSIPLLCFLSFVITRKKIINYVIFFLVILSYLTLILPGTKLAALHDVGAAGFGPGYDADVRWFRNNYNYGSVLASTGASDRFMFDVGKNLSNYIVEGSYVYWTDSMKEPEKYARWIIMEHGNPRDAVSEYIDKNKVKKYYSAEYNRGAFYIYKRNY